MEESFTQQEPAYFEGQSFLHHKKTELAALIHLGGSFTQQGPACVARAFLLYALKKQD
jgi:hypothetical protein